MKKITLVFTDYTLDLDVRPDDTFKLILTNINKYRQFPFSTVSYKIDNVDKIVDISVKLKDISHNIFYVK